MSGHSSIRFVPLPVSAPRGESRTAKRSPIFSQWLSTALCPVFKFVSLCGVTDETGMRLKMIPLSGICAVGTIL